MSKIHRVGYCIPSLIAYHRAILPCRALELNATHTGACNQPEVFMTALQSSCFGVIAAGMFAPATLALIVQPGRRVT
jgi:hypothetical protein